MRIYNSCITMLNETIRELFARGVNVFDQTVQGKVVDIKDFEQKELLGYSYMLLDFTDKVRMLEYAQKVFQKEHLRSNIGDAWLNDMLNCKSLMDTWWMQSEYLKDYWKKFGLEETGNFSYTYGTRIEDQVRDLIKRLKQNLYSRGSLITIWRRFDLGRIGRRIPCTINYHFLARKNSGEDRLNLFINQRSCDLVNFFSLDVYKAIGFLEYIAEKLNIKTGFIVHNINSLHAYHIDVGEGRKW